VKDKSGGDKTQQGEGRQEKTEQRKYANGNKKQHTQGA
jgi:hypothetical protein